MTRDATAKLNPSSSSSSSSSYSVGGGGGGDGFKFKGVRRRKWGKWVSEIRLPKSRERIWLGSYDTPKKAARAFDAAMYYLRGRQASGFNFPNDISAIEVVVFPAVKDRPLTPPEIQAAAANYANRFTETPLAPAVEDPREKKEQEQSTWGVLTSKDQEDACTATSGVQRMMDWSFLDSLLEGDGFGDGVGVGFGLAPPESESESGESGSAFQQSFLWHF